MKHLEKLVNDFKTSRPVFRLTMEHGSDRINTNSYSPVYHYMPTPIEGDVLSKLACHHYEESFNIKTQQWQIDRRGIVLCVLESIRTALTNFLLHNLEMKNPKQSKIYRWYLRDIPKTEEFNDTIIMLYKYLCTFCDGPKYKSVSPEHTLNMIAVLTAIMEKNEERGTGS